MEGRSRNRKKIKRAFTQLGAISEDHLLNSSLVEVDSSWLCGKKNTHRQGARRGESDERGSVRLLVRTLGRRKKKIYIYIHTSLAAASAWPLRMHKVRSDNAPLKMSSSFCATPRIAEQTHV